MPEERAIKQAWMRSSGRCECRRASHPHQADRCGAPLFWAHRSNRMLLGSWEALRRETGRWGAIEHFEILCWACYQSATLTPSIASEAEQRLKRSS